MIEFADREAIENHQLAALREMIGEIVPANRFYSSRLHEAGLSSGPGGLEEFFRRMPFTTKQELVDDQRDHPPYGTNLTYPLDRYTRFNQTSGTTGLPLRWLDTTESWSWMVGNWARVFDSCGVGAADRVFFAFSFGPFLGFWTAFEAAVRIGALCLPGGGMSSEGRLQAILDNQATVLCCTPTYALHLGEVAMKEGFDVTGQPLKTIIAAGEPGAGIPGVRARIEQLWPGARVRDHHGMTEIGPVSYECPARQGVLHIIAHGFIPEVIDPNSGRRLGPGDTGELLLTNLGRIGSPLIRYRTGDLVKLAPENRCECGSYEMALEGGIIGRTDDMVVIRGVNLHPSAVESVVRRFEQVAEYRVEVCTRQSLADVHLDVEPLPGCPNAGELAHDLELALRSTFNLRIPVRPVAPGTLPRFELKAKRWVREKEGPGVGGR